jgi:hypothetical protein
LSFPLIENEKETAAAESVLYATLNPDSRPLHRVPVDGTKTPVSITALDLRNHETGSET